MNRGDVLVNRDDNKKGGEEEVEIPVVHDLKENELCEEGESFEVEEEADVDLDRLIKEVEEEKDKKVSKKEKKSKINQLKDELAEKEKEVKSNYDRLLRFQAEFENYKKRVSREKTGFLKFANENLLKELLPVIDNLERAIQHCEGTHDFQDLSKGVELVLKQLHTILEKQGLTAVTAVGEEFDPCKHEAMMQVESDEHKENTVVEEFQKGYFLNDRILRPAMVSVAKKSAKEE